MLQVWRVDPWGRLRLDHLIGARALASQAPTASVLIRHRHMQVLAEPYPGAAQDLWQQWQAAGKPTREVFASG